MEKIVIFLIILAQGVSNLRFLKLQMASLKSTFVILLFESIIVATIFFSPWREFSIQNALLFLGIAVLIWAVKHKEVDLENPALRKLRNICLNLLGQRFLANSPRHFYDFFVLVALSLLIQNIEISFAVAVLFPISGYLQRLLNQQSIESSDGGRLSLIRTAWSYWVVLLRGLFLLGTVFFTTATVVGQFSLFSGNPRDGRELVSVLLQIEATVGVFAISVMFLIAQQASTEFSMRLTTMLASRKEFKTVVFVSAASALCKIAFLANKLTFLQILDRNVGIEICLLFTILVGLSYYYFGRVSIFLMSSPEVLIKETLKRFDAHWIENVDKEWGSRLAPRSLNLRDDPLVLTERIINSALKNDDLNTFQSSLIYLRHKVLALKRRSDGPALDNYLTYHFAASVRTACALKLEKFVQLFVIYFDELTQVELGQSEEINAPPFSPPLGTRFLKMTLDNTVKSNLNEITVRVIYSLGSRATSTISVLPKHSDLWALNPERTTNLKLSREEIGRLQKNDSRVETYTHGFLSLFRDVGVKSVKSRNTEVVGAVSRELCRQLVAVVTSEQIAGYQYALANHVMLALQSILDQCIEGKLPEAFELHFPYFSEKIDPETGENILAFLSNCLLRLAEAELLNFFLVMEVSLAAYHLGSNSPKGVIKLLETFSQVGKIVKKIPQFSKNSQHTMTLHELDSRSDQVAASNTQSEYEEQISAALKRAKEEAKFGPPPPGDAHADPG